MPYESGIRRRWGDWVRLPAFRSFFTSRREKGTRAPSVWVGNREKTTSSHGHRPAEKKKKKKKKGEIFRQSTGKRREISTTQKKGERGGASGLRKIPSRPSAGGKGPKSVCRLSTKKGALANWLFDVKEGRGKKKDARTPIRIMVMLQGQEGAAWPQPC